MSFLDLAPNFAGTLYGIINFTGTTTGFITPLLVAHFTQYEVFKYSIKIFMRGSVFQYFFNAKFLFKIFFLFSIKIFIDKIIL